MLLAWAAFAGFLVLSGSSLAAPSVPELDPRTVGSWPVYRGGLADSLAVSGRHAYVGTGGVQIIDLQNPRKPQVVGGYPGKMHERGEVAIDGNHLFSCLGSNGLAILDIRNPASPVLVGSFRTDALTVGVQSNRACVGTWSGAQFLDVSDPTQPKLLGQWVQPSPQPPVSGIAVSGERAYLANSISGVWILDFSQPGDPKVLGRYTGTGAGFDATDIALSGTMGYVTAWDGGLSLLDLTDPSRPTPRGHFPTSGHAVRVTVSGSYAYVSVHDNGFEILDVRDPANPRRVGGHDTPGTAYTVGISGSIACVADFDSGIQIVDVSRPEQPVALASVDTRRYIAGIAYAAPYAFLAANDLGLEVIDTTAPDRPTKVGACEEARDAAAVVLSADHRHAFVASREHGVHIVDVSDPLRPVRIGGWDAPGFVQGIKRSGSLALVTIRDRGFQVVDISAPLQPRILHNGFPPGTTQDAWDTASVGNLAFVADRLGGILIYDLSDPTQPRSIQTLNHPGATRIAIAEPFAYAVTDAGLVTFDITHPAAPIEVDLQPSRGFPAFDMLAVHDVLAVSHPSGLLLFDIRERAKPKRLGIAISITPSGIAHDGRHFLTSQFGAGIQIVDIARTSPMSWIGQLDGFRTYASIAAAGRNVAAVPDQEFRLHLIRVPPSGPLQDLAAPPDIGFPLALTFHGDLLCVESGFSMTIHDVSNPSAPRLLSEPATVAYHASLTSHRNLLYLVAGGRPPRDFFPDADGLVVFDLTDPARPVRRSQLKPPGDPYAISVTNDLGYLAVGPEGLAVLDLKNPDQPGVLGQFPTASLARDIELAKGCAFVTTTLDGIQIFDLSQPHTPRPVGFLQPGQNIRSTAYQGDFALVLTDALDIFDITNPSHPTRVGGFTTLYQPWFSQRSRLPNGDLLVATYEDGVSVLRLHPMFKSWTRNDQGTRLEWYPAPGVHLQSAVTISPNAWEDIPGTDTSTVYMAPPDGVNRTFRLSRP